MSPALDAAPVSAHLSEGGEGRSADGWFHARCICGWAAGPFPDAEISVDALMEHAYDEGWRAGTRAERGSER